ncbi:MAG: COX15/CtaA family protein [Panacagrimonas sp.]
MTAFRNLNLIAIALCFCVVVFGAYVRLADAGLGCPDWPGCYGHLGVPDANHEITAAERKFPDRPVEAPKAWKEMIHRYLASALGLLIVALAFLSVFRRAVPRMPRVLPWFLVGLVIFQGVLGMWTVTWQLKPLVVTGHLFGGLGTLSLLVWMSLASREPGARRREAESEAWVGDVNAERERPQSVGIGGRGMAAVRAMAALSLVVLVMQIFLGGWTSTNYAALACPDFPTCHGRWLPEIDVQEAYTLWRGLGINYEHGVLDNRARVTIHFFHRAGALITAVVLLALALLLMGQRSRRLWRSFGGLVLGALAFQIAVGISTVILQLPLLLAAAHNAGAAILLLILVSLNFYAWNSQRR